MAAFTDQFSCFDPLAFESFGTFEILISWFAADARALLSPALSVAQLIQVGQQLDAVIAERIPSGPRRSAVALDDLFAINDSNSPVELGDRLPFTVKPWEPYAVFSLWKLIDALVDSEIEHSLANSSVNANIVMAANALQCAHRIAGERFGTARNKLSEFESRSNQSRKSVRVRWQERDAHHQFALSLIPKYEFKQRIKVARAINDEIQNTYGKSYGDEIIDGWLKESNWSKRI